MIPETFKRTVCACSECVACCKRKPGSLIPEDVPRIEAAGVDIKRDLVASRGGLYARKDPDGTVTYYRVPTITPRMIGGRFARRCVFLDANDRCSIHAVAPFGCAYFDMHMKQPEADVRSIWMGLQQVDVNYQTLRETLRRSEDDALLSGPNDKR